MPPAAGLLRRCHADGATESEALYSPCGTWRYRLSRRWAAGPGLLFVLLNPSTATEARNDATLARCEGRARTWGFAAVTVTNLFAFRATDPRALRAAQDPVGPANDSILPDAARAAEMVLCAWGNHGIHMGRASSVAALLRATGRTLHHLGLTRDGQPRHPLYLPAARQPEPWT